MTISYAPMDDPEFMPLEPLDAASLHAAARDTGAPAPAAFVAANDAVNASAAAARDAVRARHQLIRDARRLGVPWTALSRWTQINVRTLHDIASER